jgi:hypothetical protein
MTPNLAAAKSAPPLTIPSASSINKKISRFQALTLTLTILCVIANLFFIISTQKKIKLIDSNRQVAAALKSKNQDAINTDEYLNTHQADIVKLLRVLPDENRFVDFVSTVESISKAHANNSTLEFASSTPLGAEGGKYIPFNIKLTTDTANLKEILVGIEKIPYLVEVTNVQFIATSDNLYDMTIGAKVYVQEPFIPPPPLQTKIIP